MTWVCQHRDVDSSFFMLTSNANAQWIQQCKCKILMSVQVLVQTSNVSTKFWTNKQKIQFITFTTLLEYSWVVTNPNTREWSCIWVTGFQTQNLKTLTNFFSLPCGLKKPNLFFLSCSFPFFLFFPLFPFPSSGSRRCATNQYANSKKKKTQYNLEQKQAMQVCVGADADGCAYTDHGVSRVQQIAGAVWRRGWMNWRSGCVLMFDGGSTVQMVSRVRCGTDAGRDEVKDLYEQGHP